MCGIHNTQLTVELVELSTTPPELPIKNGMSHTIWMMVEDECRKAALARNDDDKRKPEESETHSALLIKS